MEKSEIKKFESKFNEKRDEAFHDSDSDNSDKEQQKNPIRKHADKNAQKTTATTENIEVDGVDTHIPNNLPTAIFGDKGSGKSTLLRSIITLTNKKVFKHIFFVYSMLSIDEEFPDDVVRIEVSRSMNFLYHLFEIKAIFNSYMRFFMIVNKQAQKINEDNAFTDFVLNHLDNNINTYCSDVLNSNLNDYVKVDRVIKIGEDIINRYGKTFEIDGIVVDNGFGYKDLDALFIDDIAIASNILFKKIKDNTLYQYFTLTRHMGLAIFMSGQQVDQLPKPLRRETQCYLVSRNTQLELLKGVISQRNLDRIAEMQPNLKPYHFVIYNAVENYVGIV